MSNKPKPPQARPMALKEHFITKKRNRVTVLQIITACAQPLAFGNPTTAINEFASLSFDYRRAAQVHLVIESLQRYINASVAAFNAAPEDKKGEASASSMVLNFEPFDVKDLFVGGMISGRSMALLTPWLLKPASTPKEEDIVIEAPLSEGEHYNDEYKEKLTPGAAPG